MIEQEQFWSCYGQESYLMAVSLKTRTTTKRKKKTLIEFLLLNMRKPFSSYYPIR